MKERIKSLMLIAVLAFAPTAATAQVKELEKYSNDQWMNYVYISKAMLSLAKNVTTPTIPGIDVKGLMDKVDAIQIVGSKNNNYNSFRTLSNDIPKLCKDQEYDLLMQVEEKGQKTYIYIKESKKQTTLIMMVLDKNNTASVIALSGKFTTKDIEKLVEQK